VELPGEDRDRDGEKRRDDFIVQAVRLTYDRTVRCVSSSRTRGPAQPRENPASPDTREAQEIERLKRENTGFAKNWQVFIRSRSMARLRFTSAGIRSDKL
jgi:hypothetical protein